MNDTVSKTEIALSKLNDIQKTTVMNAKHFFDENKGISASRHDQRVMLKGYLNGLRDAEVLTETEDRALFIYATLHYKED